MKQRTTLPGVLVTSVLMLTMLGCISTAKNLPARAQKQTLDGLSQEMNQALRAARFEQQSALKQRGDVVNAAVKLVDTLHHLPCDTPEVIDEAYATIELVAFDGAVLMEDDMLQKFLDQTLQPQQYPIDGIVRIMTQEMLLDYQNGRTIKALDPKTRLEETQTLTAATDPVVRAMALYLLSDPYRHEDMGRVIESVNVLASEYPTMLVTFEALRRVLYV